MSKPYDEVCDKCGGDFETGYYDRNDQLCVNTCPHCQRGTNLTPRGEQLIEFLKRNYWRLDR